MKANGQKQRCLALRYDFPDTPIMCLRVSNDIDAVIWVKHA